MAKTIYYCSCCGLGQENVNGFEDYFFCADCGQMIKTSENTTADTSAFKNLDADILYKRAYAGQINGQLLLDAAEKDFPQALMDMGAMHLSKKEYDKAETFFKRGYEKGDSLCALLYALARNFKDVNNGVDFGKENLTEPIAILEKHPLDNKLWKAYYNYLVTQKEKIEREEREERERAEHIAAASYSSSYSSDSSYSSGYSSSYSSGYTGYDGVNYDATGTFLDSRDRVREILASSYYTPEQKRAAVEEHNRHHLDSLGYDPYTSPYSLSYDPSSYTSSGGSDTTGCGCSSGGASCGCGA